MKIFLEGMDMILDLSDEDQEVVEYVLDNFEDRLTGVEMRNIIFGREQELDYAKKRITVTNLIQEVVEQIIEEKRADMECRLSPAGPGLPHVQET